MPFILRRREPRAFQLDVDPLLWCDDAAEITMDLNEDYRHDVYHKISHSRRMICRRGIDTELLDDRVRRLQEKQALVEEKLNAVS